MRRRDRGDRARVRGGRGWACLDSGLRLAAAGEAGWVGPSGEEMARGLAGLTSLFSLSYIYFSRKAKREKKRKGGLGKENAQGDNFLGLTKICSYQEK